MKKVLVTGVNGFVGHHVAMLLQQQGVGVVGCGNQTKIASNLTGVIKDYYGCDLTDSTEVAKINLSDIDAIINLAGFAKVGASRGQSEIYNRVNVGVHTTLYEECLKQGVKPRIIAISTGAVYDPTQPMPITEDSRLSDDDKTNEYVISKKLAEKEIAKFNERGLRCIIARPFNHTGPGQLPGFLLPDLYEQIQKSKQNNEPLKVGNLDTKRDFTDVRDVARAYKMLALSEESALNQDIYNICSGKSIPGRQILEILAEACGTANIKTVIDPNKIRPNEIMDIYGSNRAIQDSIGWKPEISIEHTIKDFVTSL